MARFYPSVKATLLIRFEDFGRATKKDIPTPKKSTIRLKGIKDQRGELKVIDDPDAPTGTKRFILTANGSPPAKKVDGKTNDGFSHKVTHVVPVNASWHVTSPRTARSLTMKLRWGDLPLDPRIIRAIGVEFYMGVIRPERFAYGVGGATAETLGAGGDKTPLNLVPDQFVDSKGRIRSNLRFRGWVDVLKLDWADGVPTIDLECKDNTQLFLKQIAPAKLTVAVDKPIDEAIALYLSHFPQFQGLRIQYRPNVTRDKDTPPRLKTLLSPQVIKADTGPPVGGGGSGGGDSDSVWDYLTTVCGAIAHGIYVEDQNGITTVVVGRGTSIVDKRVLAREDETYIPRVVGDTDCNVRTLVFGSNLESLSVKREYTKKAAVNIEVRSYDATRKNLIVARFPEEKDRVVNALPAQGQNDHDWKVYRLRDGITDLKTLKAVAEETYNNGRLEIGVDLKTKDLCAYGGDESDPDLLDIRNGDPIRLLVGAQGSVSAMGKTEAIFGSPAGMAEDLQKKGFSAEFAKAAAKSYNDASFQTLFRVGEAGFDWDAEQGISVSIMAMNYIEARVDRPAVTDVQVRGNGKKKK